jgi:hypothetical protein
MPENGPSAPLADNFPDSRSAFERELKSQETRVREAPKVRANLETLEAFGADPNTVLRLLVLSVKRNMPDFKDELKESMRRLKRLSNQLKDVSRDLESAFSDPLIFAEFWVPILFPSGGELPDTDWLKTVPNEIVAEMHRFSKGLCREERKLAKLAKMHHRKQVNRPLAALVMHVRESTNGNHDELLAELLQTAHQELKSSEEFSGPQIRKFRQRHVSETVTPRKKPGRKLSNEEMLKAMGLWDNSKSEN